MTPDQAALIAVRACRMAQAIAFGNYDHAKRIYRRSLREQLDPLHEREAFIATGGSPMQAIRRWPQ